MLPWRSRIDLVCRAQCDLLGSFRFCADKRCRRHRTCISDHPAACLNRLWCRGGAKPKTLLAEWDRIERLKAL